MSYNHFCLFGIDSPSSDFCKEKHPHTVYQPNATNCLMMKMAVPLSRLKRLNSENNWTNVHR